MNNNKSNILRIALATPLRKSFDYFAPYSCDSTQLQPGIRVKVPFQQRQLIGVLLEVASETTIEKGKIKQALEIIDKIPVIPQDILRLCLWAADYYHYPIGEVIDSALPVFLRQGKAAQLTNEAYWQLTEQGLAVDLNSLTRAPKQALALTWLATHAEGVTKKQIQEQAISWSLVKILVQKGWLIKNAKPISLMHEKKQVEAALKLNLEQQQALTSIKQGLTNFNVYLLEGITGSGKTEIYLQAITEVLLKQKQILVLVPEIGLTPQTIQRFRQRFAQAVLALHSGLSDKERLNAYLMAKANQAQIIIGTRSAVFTPFANLGLIIVDEEHDLSFKQQEGFRYHARDLAIMRAQHAKIPIILGSATPSLETLARTLQGKYQHLRLTQRAGEAQQASFAVLDIRNTYLEQGLSPSLLSALRQHIENGDQVLLFLNRRGFAPVLMCHACGWTAVCKRCEMRMTFHHDPKRLHCHHCDSRKNVNTHCEKCGEASLQVIGLGTERLEQALQKYFPHISIARIDKDSTQVKGSMENLLAGIHSGEYQILIGTQMIAKGHHFPNVTLVGIVDADGGFFSSDFRAIERMGQLVLQVAGRAGRDSKPGTVMIQTRHPDNPLLHQLIRESYHHFAKSLLKERELALLPPYAYLALFRAEAHNLDSARQFLKEIKNVADNSNQLASIWGPVPAPMPKRAGRYRLQLLIQSKNRSNLHKLLNKLLISIEKMPSKQQVRWSLDVDPLEMC
jgi:primosomal protein N' (replication factor Y) (superfamily II helicase)